MKLLGLGLLLFCAVGRADIFDRINQCEYSGGGSCVYNLLRELARNAPGTGFLQSGLYASETWRMTISVTGNTAEIVGDATISERGVYQCTGASCVGPTYSFTVISPQKIQMSYGRIWDRVNE